MIYQLHSLHYFDQSRTFRSAHSSGAYELLHMGQAFCISFCGQVLSLWFLVCCSYPALVWSAVSITCSPYSASYTDLTYQDDASAQPAAEVALSRMLVSVWLQISSARSCLTMSYFLLKMLCHREAWLRLHPHLSWELCTIVRRSKHCAQRLLLKAKLWFILTGLFLMSRSESF